MSDALPALAVFAAAYLISALRGARWVHLPAALVVVALGLAALRPVPVATAAPEPAPVAALPAEDAPAALAIPPGVPERMARWHPLVVEAAAGAGLDPLWLYAYMEVESDGDPAAISVDSAIRLMQIIPREKCAPGAFAYACSRPTTAELLDPATNLAWAAAHIAGLHAEYGAWEGARRYYGYTPSATDEWYADTVTGNYARLVEAASAPPRFPATPLRPMPGLIRAFGVPVNYQAGGVHTGIDIAGPRVNGEEPELYAVAPGAVAYVGPLYCAAANACRGGKAIILDHGGNVYSIYSHNSAAYVAAGDTVTAGQSIGRQGNEGYSFGSHLHLEVHTGAPFTGDWLRPFEGGEFADPLAYLP